MTSKQDKIFQVAVAIFPLEAKYGHLLWKVTDLEKKSKVSRALIYRYFGSSKKQIFAQALNIFLNQFYGFDKNSMASIPFSERIMLARDLIQKHSEAVAFYQKWRSSNSEYQKLFLQVEKKFQKKLKKIFPKLDEREILTAHACIHGLVTSPFLTPEEAALAAEELVRKGIFGVS